MICKPFIIFLFVFCSQYLFAQNFRVVDELSRIRFVIQNAGMATEGSFSGVSGNILFTPAALKSSSFSVTIDASTVNTEIEVRDLALQSSEYLDTQKYPELSFTSTQILATAIEGRFIVKGNITIKGISKGISFPFTVSQIKDGILLKGDMKLNRRDYKIAVSSLVLSDLITISLSVVAQNN